VPNTLALSGKTQRRVAIEGIDYFKAFW